jgi:hypothetical protein
LQAMMKAYWETSKSGTDAMRAVLDVLHAHGYRRCAEGQRTTQWCERANKAEAMIARLTGDLAGANRECEVRNQRELGYMARAESAEAEAGRLRKMRDGLGAACDLSAARAEKAEAALANLQGDYTEEASYLRKRAEKAEAEVERLREYIRERELIHAQSLDAARGES